MLIQLTWTKPQRCCACKEWVISGWQQPVKAPGGYYLEQYCDTCGLVAGAVPDSKHAPAAKENTMIEPLPLERLEG